MNLVPFPDCGLSLPVSSSAWPARHFSCAAVAALADAHVPVAAGRPAALFPSPFDVSKQMTKEKRENVKMKI